MTEAIIEKLDAVISAVVRIETTLSELIGPKNAVEILPGGTDTDPVSPYVPPVEEKPEIILSPREKAALAIALHGYHQASENFIECPDNPAKFIDPDDGYKWVKLDNSLCSHRDIWKRVAV